MGYSNIEVVRAALSACSFDAATGARAVHISRLTGFAGGYGLDGDAVKAELEPLELTRQVQKLGGGHWIPAPTRVVDLGTIRLFLSAQPSETLTTLNTNISAGLGYARLISETLDLPEEPLESWLDAPSDSAEWATLLLARASTEAQTFVGPQEAELLGLDNDRWMTAVVPKDLPIDSQWRVARYGMPKQYALVTRSPAGTREFRCTRDDARRAAYGLQRMRGKPFELTIRQTRSLQIRIEGPTLPSAERRLITSLARAVPNAWQTYELPPAAVSVAVEHFKRLGMSATEQ